MKISPMSIVIMIFYGIVILLSVITLCVRWFRLNTPAITMVTARHNDDDVDPCLLSDDELTESHYGDDFHGNEDDDVARSNYLRNLVENQELPVPGTIKTVDEVRYVSYQLYVVRLVIPALCNSVLNYFVACQDR